MTASEQFAEFVFRELYRAYLDARKHKRNSFDEHRFELRDLENLWELSRRILTGQYRPSSSLAFVIREPVVREIFAARFEDRVVHHFVCNQTTDWWERHFINDAYSCRKNKGALYGQRRLQHFMLQASQNCQKSAFMVKMDLAGYFMSLSRERLYARVLWGLERQFSNHQDRLFRLLKNLWRVIIFDDPIKNVRIRGAYQDWRAVPHNKSLFYQEPGRGIVIGNLTSQWLSNIYLDQLDRFIIYTLKYPYYGRYVDDFFIIVPEADKAQLLRDIPVIANFLDHLELSLHPKKQSKQPVERGLPFLGARVFRQYMLPGQRIRQNAKTCFRAVAAGQGDLDSVVSYLGHLRHYDSNRFLQRNFDDLGWVFTPFCSSRRA